MKRQTGNSQYQKVYKKHPCIECGQETDRHSNWCENCGEKRRSIKVHGYQKTCYQKVKAKRLLLKSKKKEPKMTQEEWMERVRRIFDV